MTIEELNGIAGGVMLHLRQNCDPTEVTGILLLCLMTLYTWTDVQVTDPNQLRQPRTIEEFAEEIKREIIKNYNLNKPKQKLILS